MIQSLRGQNGTHVFESVHSVDHLKFVDHVLIGKVNEEQRKLLKVAEIETERKETGSGNEKQNVAFVKPPISKILNTIDLEIVASRVLSEIAWSYFSSGADDEISLRENRQVFGRIWFRPRVCIDVSKVDPSLQFFGQRISFPCYITATALAKLADPLGEIAYVRAAKKEMVPYMISTLSSCSQDEVYKSSVADQIMLLQLYLHPDRKISDERVKLAEAAGVKAVFITVDAPQLGRRERDIRAKAGLANGAFSVSGNLSTGIDPSVCWSDCINVKKATKMKVFLKGIQNIQDALLAFEYGFDGIVISNHGGRQLDICLSSIEILAEIMPVLRQKGVDFTRFEVYVDGGVRRGSDIFKALALGAKAVGLGRCIIYGLAAYGQEGVELVLRLLRDEFEVIMKLNGCKSLADISPSMVVTNQISHRYQPSYKDFFSRSFLGYSRL